MNEAIHLLHAPRLPSSGSAAVADQRGSTDFYATWKSIFEKLHSSEHADGLRNAQVSKRHQSLADSIGTRRAGSRESLGAQLPWAASEALAHVETSASNDAARMEPSTLRQVTADREQGSASYGQRTVTIPSASVTHEPEAHSALTTAEISHVSASLRPPTAAAPAESILVLLSGASLTIVLRDTTLSERDALQAAFATASELTGQRSALHSLTLNGRTVYQHRELPPSGAQASAAWVLAC